MTELIKLKSIFQFVTNVKKYSTTVTSLQLDCVMRVKITSMWSFNLNSCQYPARWFSVDGYHQCRSTHKARTQTDIKFILFLSHFLRKTSTISKISLLLYIQLQLCFSCYRQDGQRNPNETQPYDVLLKVSGASIMHQDFYQTGMVGVLCLSDRSSDKINHPHWVDEIKLHPAVYSSTSL